jgi:hypothetical protein
MARWHASVINPHRGGIVSPTAQAVGLRGTEYSVSPGRGGPHHAGATRLVSACFFSMVCFGLPMRRRGFETERRGTIRQVYACSGTWKHS